MLLHAGQKNHKPYYKDNFHAYMHIKQTSLIVSCKTICWCYVIVSIKCCKLQIHFIYIYKHANCQGSITFSKYFERETLGPVERLTDRSISFHLLANCCNSNSKCSSCMWSYKWDRGILIENNRTSPMMDTEYEDKLLNVGFVLRSL